MDILSEKCSLEKEDVRRKYEEFQATYPEGEITKEEFLDSMSVIPFHLKVFEVFLVDLKCILIGEGIILCCEIY